MQMKHSVRLPTCDGQRSIQQAKGALVQSRWNVDRDTSPDDRYCIGSFVDDIFYESIFTAYNGVVAAVLSIKHADAVRLPTEV